MKDSEIKKPKSGSYDHSDATAGDREALWKELQAIGVTKPKTLKQHIMTKLDGVTEDGLPKEDRTSGARGVQGVRFVASANGAGGEGDNTSIDGSIYL